MTAERSNHHRCGSLLFSSCSLVVLAGAKRCMLTH